jgi:hypothetical protein
MIDWLLLTGMGAISLSLKVTAIVVALMLAHGVIKRLLPEDSGGHSERLLALVAGLTLGIVYGAGVIIKAGQEGNLSSRDLFLIALFLSTCHAVVEDTLLFVAVGGNFFWMLGTRLVIAILVTGTAALFLRRPPPLPE